jgi:DNA invertase Pin-like site-specific DNA recombinase
VSRESHRARNKNKQTNKPVRALLLAQFVPRIALEGVDLNEKKTKNAKVTLFGTSRCTSTKLWQKLQLRDGNIDRQL